jgi:hypothetical protein
MPKTVRFGLNGSHGLKEQKGTLRRHGVMKGVADIAAADTTSIYNSRAADLRPGGMGKYTGRQTFPTHDEIAQAASSLYESGTDRMATMLKLGWVRNRNSYATTPNYKQCRRVQPMES